MKQQTTKQFFASPAGKLTLAIVAMGLCWTILIVYLSNTSAGGTWFPSEADMNHVRQEIKNDTKTLNTEMANQDAFDNLQDDYEDSLATYWNADRDGEPETELRNLINDAAQRAEANLQTLGSVRTSTINNELSYADLDFTVVDEYSKVIRFFAEVEKCTPRLSWRRVELRVEPSRARAVTGPGRQNNAAAAAATTTAQMFRTTGQVRVIKYSPAGNPSGKTAAAGKTATATKTTTTATKTTTAAAAASATTAASSATPEETPATNNTTTTTTQQPAASSTTPAQAEPAATATPNKENGK